MTKTFLSETLCLFYCTYMKTAQNSVYIIKTGKKGYIYTLKMYWQNNTYSVRIRIFKTTNNNILVRTCLYSSKSIHFEANIWVMGWWYKTEKQFKKYAQHIDTFAATQMAFELFSFIIGVVSSVFREIFAEPLLCFFLSAICSEIFECSFRNFLDSHLLHFFKLYYVTKK